MHMPQRRWRAWFDWQEKSKEKDKKPIHGRKAAEPKKKKQLLTDLQVRDDEFLSADMRTASRRPFYAPVSHG